MSTKPYIITDEKRLRAHHFGKGSIVVITDDLMAELCPVRFNGCKDPTICLQIASDVRLDDVRNGMPKHEVDDMLDQLQDEMPDHSPLGGQGLSRPENRSWAKAAETLRLLATVCEDRAKELTPSTTTNEE